MEDEGDPLMREGTIGTQPGAGERPGSTGLLEGEEGSNPREASHTCSTISPELVEGGGGQ